jgi:hypothetical protein
MRPVALGMKSHIGWAAVVALAGVAARAKLPDRADTLARSEGPFPNQQAPRLRSESTDF